jgi:hypothetical protein
MGEGIGVLSNDVTGHVKAAISNKRPQILASGKAEKKSSASLIGNSA